MTAIDPLLSSEEQIVSVLFYAIGLVVFMALAIILFFIFSRRRVVKIELEKANLQIAHQKAVIQSTIITQEEERQRIAQDLHDAISSKLNIVSLNANLLTESEINSTDTNAIGKSILKVTSDVLESSRKIAHALLPPTLDKFGLMAALEELCEEVEESRKFKLVQRFDYQSGVLSSEQELHLFRITQELFSNTIKYAEASTITLHLISDEKSVSLKYEDDGKGFVVSEAKKAKGLGMTGIENRAAILHADCALTSSPGNGMTVDILVAL